jgi:transposase
VPAAHPLALRKRAVEAYCNHEGTLEEIAVRFDVGHATMKRWWWAWMNEKRLVRLPNGGARVPRKLTAEAEAVLRATLAQRPDSTREEIAARIRDATGVRMSAETVGRELKRLGFSRKKGLCTPRKGTGQTS